MRQRKSINQINVVPYIDVMLVLLVIFMVTAPLVTPGVIDLPSVGSPVKPASAPLTVRVARNGSLTLRGHIPGLREQAVSLEELVTLARGAQGTEPKAVVIEADKGVVYDRVLDVLDRLKLAGTDKVGLLVKPAGQ